MRTVTYYDQREIIETSHGLKLGMHMYIHMKFIIRATRSTIKLCTCRMWCTVFVAVDWIIFIATKSSWHHEDWWWASQARCCLNTQQPIRINLFLIVWHWTPSSFIFALLLQIEWFSVLHKIISLSQLTTITMAWRISFGVSRLLDSDLGKKCENYISVWPDSYRKPMWTGSDRR